MKKGFTLIELLVVIAIIAILAAILFPVFARARDKARQTTCTSNQKQIAATILMYSQDHDESLPSTGSVWADLKMDAGVLICPNKGKKYPNGYVYNNQMGSQSISFDDPTSKMLTGDGISATKITKAKNVCYGSNQLDARHSGKFILSYLDGHVGATDIAPDFLPDVEKTNLKVWLQARAFQGKLAYNASVTSWSGSINGTTITAKQVGTNAVPTFNPMGINNCPSIHFEPISTGYGQVLEIPQQSLTDCTIFMVIQDVAGRGYYGSFLDEVCNINFNIAKGDVAGRFRASCQKSSPAYSQVDANRDGLTEGIPRIVILRRQMSTGTISFSTDTASPVNTTTVTGGITSTFNWGSIWMGASQGNANWGQLNGDIGEVLIYKKSLTDTDANTIASYLNDQFGL